MEGDGSDKEGAVPTAHKHALRDIVLSWSLEEIYDENRYRNEIPVFPVVFGVHGLFSDSALLPAPKFGPKQRHSTGQLHLDVADLLQINALHFCLPESNVEKIPQSFESIEQYFGSYVYPLLEETRAQLYSSMEIISRAPFAEILESQESGPYGSKLFDVKVDHWRNRSNVHGEVPYKTLPGDIFVLADAKPEHVSDLQRMQWAFVAVTKIPDDEYEDNSTSTRFEVEAHKDIEVDGGTRQSLFVIFLTNIIHNKRIWNALHMPGNQKIIKKILCADSMSDSSWHEKFGTSVTLGLDKSQTEAVLACLRKIHCNHKSAVELIWGPPGTGKTKTTSTLLFKLLEMGYRTLTCAPTNVAIKGVSSCVLELVKESIATDSGTDGLFCSVGDILLFGSKASLKLGSDIEEIYLDYRVQRLTEFLGPATGWRHCFASMIDLLGDCVPQYHRFLQKESIKAKEQSNEKEIEEGESSDKTDGSKRKYESFLDFLRERFVSTSTPLKNCFRVFCTHLPKKYILENNYQNMVSRIGGLLESFGKLLFQHNVESVALEKLFSDSELHEDIENPFVDISFLLHARRKECLLVLKNLRSSFNELDLPSSTGQKISAEAGFGRSLFERLILLGKMKHLLNVQYRMHPSISSFPNSNFYFNQILDASKVKRKSYEKQYLPWPMFGAYSFINIVGGREEKDDVGHGWRNLVEVAVVMKLLRKLYKEKLSVGVISPYAAQVAAIQDKLGRYYNIEGFAVKLKSVDGFQGGEEDIIILSTVRCNRYSSVGFMSKPQRTNVALTRARHCLWILGNESTLANSDSVWEALVLDAKNRQCFFNADEDKDLHKAIFYVKKALDQFDDLLNSDSILFRNARWKCVQQKKSAINHLLMLSNGWRPKKRSLDPVCESSSQMLKQFKIGDLYIICANDIVKEWSEEVGELRYIQVFKIWDILPAVDIPKLVKRLDSLFRNYTDDFLHRCKEKCLQGSLEVPKSWSITSDIVRIKNAATEGSNYVENAVGSESLMLMKFYSLSSGVVGQLLSTNEDGELDLPFEVNDEEREVILFPRSAFIIGRSGTGKTTVLTMKLLEKEKLFHMAADSFGYKVTGNRTMHNQEIEEAMPEARGTILRQLL
ncbi:hypothetical protein CJ030_MR7G021969 [Morella rubra]|uniref:Helicase MAGATAMA 3 n=1 Tax=Morella rubra TaxID=262757 RepID=A0A6A1UXZ8_9ROSI|nr:hypothetical protein CJ030_MR7G021969 [Morella rubra]